MNADVANRQLKADEENGVVLNEIPDDLKRFVAYIAKAFYGPEFYVVLHYISLSATIKEEELRIKTTFDQRFLRKILAQLKMDKIVSERCEMEETDGRVHRVAYYHINYRGLINVVKYKLDHMRRRMEMKENETMSKMSYKCVGCDYTYGALDMDRIFDIATSKMKCYRCQQEVIVEESILPIQQTRSSLARFNDQMMRIFILLERLEGIRLAHHLLEPPIGPVTSNLSKVENEKSVEMNERAFNGSASITHSTMQRGDITIHMEDENTSSKTEAKEIVPWLHNAMQPSLFFVTEVGNSRENISDSMSRSTKKGDVDSSSESPAVTDIEDLLMSEFKEDVSSRSVAELKKETVDCDLISEGSASENGDTIYVEGRRYDIDELTPELVLQMTAAEKEAYVRITQENFEC